MQTQQLIFRADYCHHIYSAQRKVRQATHHLNWTDVKRDYPQWWKKAINLPNMTDVYSCSAVEHAKIKLINIVCIITSIIYDIWLVLSRIWWTERYYFLLCVYVWCMYYISHQMLYLAYQRTVCRAVQVIYFHIFHGLSLSLFSFLLFSFAPFFYFSFSLSLVSRRNGNCI